MKINILLFSTIVIVMMGCTKSGIINSSNKNSAVTKKSTQNNENKNIEESLDSTPQVNIDQREVDAFVFKTAFWTGSDGYIHTKGYRFSSGEVVLNVFGLKAPNGEMLATTEEGLNFKPDVNEKNQFTNEFTYTDHEGSTSFSVVISFKSESKISIRIEDIEHNRAKAVEYTLTETSVAYDNLLLELEDSFVTYYENVILPTAYAPDNCRQFMVMTQRCIREEVDYYKELLNSPLELTYSSLNSSGDLFKFTKLFLKYFDAKILTTTYLDTNEDYKSYLDLESLIEFYTYNPVFSGEQIHTKNHKVVVFRNTNEILKKFVRDGVIKAI